MTEVLFAWTRTARKDGEGESYVLCKVGRESERVRFSNGRRVDGVRREEVRRRRGACDCVARRQRGRGGARMIMITVSNEDREKVESFGTWLVENDFCPSDIEERIYFKGRVVRYALTVAPTSGTPYFNKCINEVKRRVERGLL